MDIVILITALILCTITICIVVTNTAKQEKPVNKVHFYVARDSDDALYLYLGKPVRRNRFWGTGDNSLVIGDDANFFLEKCGLKWEDFKDLKWKNKPVEVFLNMED